MPAASAAVRPDASATAAASATSHGLSPRRRRQYFHRTADTPLQQSAVLQRASCYRCGPGGDTIVTRAQTVATGDRIIIIIIIISAFYKNLFHSDGCPNCTPPRVLPSTLIYCRTTSNTIAAILYR